MKLKLDDFLAKQPELAPDRREEFQWLFRELPEERCRILDAACGGNWLQFHLEQAGHESHSVDFDPAAATFNDLTPRPNFTLSNLLDPLPYADEFFDHILLISTTEHIESPTDDWYPRDHGPTVGC